MKREFKVGQRVRIRQWDDMVKEFGLDRDGDIELPSASFFKSMKPLCGKSATIHQMSLHAVSLGDFENCKDLDTPGMYSIEMIEPLEEPDTIVIYRKGRETVAFLKDGKTVVKAAKAKCCPTDVYDFEVGAKLAFSRLMEGDKAEKINVEIPFKFKIGDRVIVVNVSEVYPNYYQFISKFASDCRCQFINGSSPRHGLRYTVLGRGIHDRCRSNLYIIQDDWTLQAFVIGENGLKQV